MANAALTEAGAGRPGVVDYALLCLLASIWGGSFMLARIAVAEVPPVTMTLLRQLVAVVIFIGLLLWTGQRLRAQRSDHLLIILSAFFGMALPFSLVSWGLEDVTAGFAAILMGLMPLMTVVLAHLTTDDEKMNAPKIAGVCFGIAGLVVLFWPDLVDGSDSLFWRQMAIMGAGVSYAINALLTKRLLHLPARPMFAANIGWSVVMLLPVALLTEPLPDRMPSAQAWLAILLIGAFSTALASLLLFRIIGRQGASFFSQINLLVPLAGVLWGAVILAERLPANAFIALAVIIAGVALARLGTRNNTMIQENTS